MAQLCGGAGDELAGADDGHEVAGVERIGHLGARDGAGLAAAQTREGDLLAELLVDVTDEGVVVALDADRAVRQGRGRILVVAAVVQGRHRGGEHADDAEEVGDRIPDGRSGGVAAGFAGRGERRGVRDGTGEGTGDEGNVHAQGPCRRTGRAWRRCRRKPPSSGSGRRRS